MAKVSDLWYKPVNPEIIDELMTYVNVGNGKDYTSKSVGFNTKEDLFPFIIGEEVVWAKSLIEALCKSRIGSCKIQLPYNQLLFHWA